VKKKPNSSDNAEFSAVDAALRRAAKSAHNLARKTKTPCYIWKDGAIVNVTAQKKGKKLRQTSVKTV
jgi:hypothetical protein